MGETLLVGEPSPTSTSESPDQIRFDVAITISGRVNRSQLVSLVRQQLSNLGIGLVKRKRVRIANYKGDVLTGTFILIIFVQLPPAESVAGLQVIAAEKLAATSRSYNIGSAAGIIKACCYFLIESLINNAE